MLALLFIRETRDVKLEDLDDLDGSWSSETVKMDTETANQAPS